MGKLSKGSKYNFSIKNFIFNGEQIGNISVTIYGHSPLLLNISGIKSLDQVNIIKELIEKLYIVKCLDVRIDNVFVSHKNNLNLDVVKMYYFLRDDPHFHVDYNIELFPGLYLRPKQKDYPTIVIFRTGSYQIMGKSMVYIEDSIKFVKKLIIMFNKCT